MDQLLEKHNLRRALRIGTWIARIVHNFTSHVKLSGPLIDSGDRHSYETVDLAFTEERLFNVPLRAAQRKLNLKVNHEGLVECRGRIGPESMSWQNPRKARSLPRILIVKARAISSYSPAVLPEPCTWN